MRKIVVSMHVSLDGYVAGPNGEMDWIKLDESMFDFVKTFTDSADTALYGRVTWQMMDSYWPSAADQPDASRHDKEHSEWYNKVNKVVLSNSMKNKSADKTIFLNGDISAEIKKIKHENGKDILIFGSPSAVHTFTADNLIDDYWLFVNPVLLGNGIPLFVKHPNKIELTFKESKVFSCGVTAQHYSL